MIIDFHVHAATHRSSPFRDVKRFKPIVEFALELGIDRLCVSSIRYPEANEDVLRLMKAFPERILGFCYLSPLSKNPSKELRRWIVNHGMVGLKVHEEGDWRLSRLLELSSLFDEAADLEVPVLIHSWHEQRGLPPGAEKHLGRARFPVDLMRKVAERCPRTVFIFAHMGGCWEKAVKAVEPYRNVYLDTSGFDPEMGIVEMAVERLGAERVIYGSDAPGRSFAAQVAKVIYADISEADKRLILGENAAKILRLG